MTKEVLKVLQELKDEMRNDLRLFKEALERSLRSDERNLRIEMEEVKRSLDFISKGLDEANGRSTAIQKENNLLKKENDALRQKVSTLETDLSTSQHNLMKNEQYSRNRNVEIKGVQQEPSENIVSIVQKIGEVVGEPLSPTDIDVCHRVPTKNASNTNIVVQFQRREKREKFLEKARKKRITNDTLELGSDEPIYINEHLCPGMKRLLGMASARKRENGWKFLWVKNGSIFARRAEKSPVVYINCESDINKICADDAAQNVDRGAEKSRMVSAHQRNGENISA